MSQAIAGWNFVGPRLLWLRSKNRLPQEMWSNYNPSSFLLSPVIPRPSQVDLFQLLQAMASSHLARILTRRKLLFLHGLHIATYRIRWLAGLHVSARRNALTKFTMPAMSPTMTEGGIASWKKKAGDSFVTGDVLLEIVHSTFVNSSSRLKCIDSLPY